MIENFIIYLETVHDYSVVRYLHTRDILDNRYEPAGKLASVPVGGPVEERFAGSSVFCG